MKSLVVSIFVILILFLSVNTVNALEEKEPEEPINDSDQISDLYNELPSSVQNTLQEMGVNLKDDTLLQNVSFQSVITEILRITAKESAGVFTSFVMITAVLLLYSLTEGFFQSITNDNMKEVLSVVSALCIACALVIPVTNVIDVASSAIVTASDFMLAFIPVMVAVLISCGKTLSGSGYYSMMVFASQGIAQLSSKFITPMLNVFLGVSISSALVPQVHLEGVTDLFSKTIKWMLSFSFTIFSAFLTFKTLISTAVDSVSTRAVRFTMSSFIPVVGAALSEAYKTVQGSVNILKHGIGIFVIFAVAAVFLPVIMKLTLWSFSVSVCKSVSVMLSLSVPTRMLSGVSTVLSVLLATLICIMALFIISTALIITAGGYST